MNASTAAMLQRSFYAVALLLGVVAILYGASVWLVPLALAVLLAFILMPIVDWLERHRLPRIPAVTVAAVVSLVLIVAAGYVVTLQLNGLATHLQENGSTYKANIKAKLAPVLDVLDSAQQLQELGKKGAAEASGTPRQAPPDPTPVVVESHATAMLSWLPTLVLPVLDIGARSLLVVVLAMFILVRRESLRDRVLSLLGPRNLAGATRAINDTATRVSRYLFLLLWTNVGVGIAVAIGLYCIGVPYAILWGALAAALRFIPYVGVWIAAVLAFGLSVAIFPSWGATMLVAALFLVIELAVANVVEPLVFGHGTGVSPLPLLIAAVFWTWLWGPAGLVLSTPLTVCLVVLGQHVPALRFFDVLLGARPALDTASRYYQRLLASDQDEAAAILQTELQGKPLDAVCDEVVLPALARARTDHDDRELSAEEARAVLRGTRLMLGTALAPASVNGADAKDAPAVTVLGCPVHGAADALALQMLRLLLGMAGVELKLVSARRLPEEVRALVARGEPAVVCVGVVQPGGMAQAFQACRRVRHAAADAHVVVGRWGAAAENAQADERLKSAGAVAVGVTLHETLDHVLAALGMSERDKKPRATQPHPAA
jgi:predicted PurR-regulated permease PerM